VYREWGSVPGQPSAITASGTVVLKHTVPRYNVQIAILGCHRLSIKITFGESERPRNKDGPSVGPAEAVNKCRARFPA
jgi:hypothetical protein